MRPETERAFDRLDGNFARIEHHLQEAQKAVRGLRTTLWLCLVATLLFTGALAQTQSSHGQAVVSGQHSPDGP